MNPLTCTQTGLFHVDYGVPLVANKSTDYRTSTGKNHGFRPSIPQYFDCRVKAHIKPELLNQDIALRNFITTNAEEFKEKFPDVDDARHDRAVTSSRVDYSRVVEEKIFAKPPPPRGVQLSEMKDSYPTHYVRHIRDKFPKLKCQMPETFRGVQPNIDPATKGYEKLLDIYLTENRLKYVPYTPEQLAKAQEDLITIYNSEGKHKGLKEELPGKMHGRKTVYDKSVFKLECPNRIMSKAPKRVPHSGMRSEYQSNYPNPTCSEFHPYLKENGVYFPESLPETGPWQNLCPPAMYCSENCHIGTGWPVRAVVDVNAPSSEHLAAHSEPCCTRI